MIRRSWKSLLAGIAMASSVTAANTVFAADGCGTTGCATSGCSDCQQCERIFSEAGQKLTDQLAGMSCCGNCCTENNCCAPASVCDPGCSAPCGDILSDACGEGCGGLDDAAEGRKLGIFGDWGNGITLGGWTQFGYQDAPDGAFTGNGAFNSVNFGPGTFPNAHEWNKFNLNQQALYINKTADGSNGLGLGFRAEMMYGVDGNEAQSFGNTPGHYDFVNGWDHGIYEWALPQLYAEAAMGDLSVKVGHFYTTVGYEVIPSGGNFFLSRQLTFYNSEPFTHTGVLATYSASDDLQVMGGWTAGWDTGFNQLSAGVLPGVSGGSNFLGGFIYTLSESTTFTYMMTAGNLGWRGDGSVNSIILTQNWSDKLSSVHQFDALNTNNVNQNFQTTGTAKDSTGLINYLFYEINDKLKAGIRQEWYKADGTSYNTMTYGVNIKPMDNVVIRPEYRQMWAPGAYNSVAAPGHENLYNSDVLGIDVIVTY